MSVKWSLGADLGEGAGGVHPRDDMQFSNTTGILQKKTLMWFIGVEVEQETSAPPLTKDPGSAPGHDVVISIGGIFFTERFVCCMTKKS